MNFDSLQLLDLYSDADDRETIYNQVLFEDFSFKFTGSTLGHGWTNIQIL